jgi:hypothetical protein
MLHEFGLDDLVADSREAYRDLIVGLIGDPARLVEVRTRCRSAAERHAAGGARRLAAAVEDVCAGLARRFATAPG